MCTYISYDWARDQIFYAVNCSFWMMDRVLKTYESLIEHGKQETRVLLCLGKNAYKNHIRILRQARLYPFEELIKLVYGFELKKAVSLLGQEVVSIKSIEGYPIGTCFTVRQIVYEPDFGILLNLDLSPGREEIMGPVDRKDFKDCFVFV
jgi:hypothetical protein